MTYKITTAKGSHGGSLHEVCAWQATHQGAYAEIITPDGWTLDVRDVDFDPDDLEGVVATVQRLRRTYL